MANASNEQVRDLTWEEVEHVTGGFLGKLIRKVGRVAGAAAPLGDAAAEGPGLDFSDA